MTTDINLDASLGSMPRPQNWISHLYPSENNTAVKDSKETKTENRMWAAKTIQAKFEWN